MVYTLLIRIGNIFRKEPLSGFNDILVSAEVILSIYIVVIEYAGYLGAHLQKTFKRRRRGKSNAVELAAALLWDIASKGKVIMTRLGNLRVAALL